MNDVSPADAEVALRSLPRRFRAALASATSEDENEDDLGHRAGPDGRTAADVLSETTLRLSTLDRALEQVLTSSEPHVDVKQVALSPGARRTIDEVQLDLELAAVRMADRVHDTPAADWIREGRTTHDGSVQAIELVRRAVTESVDRLRLVEKTLQAVRR